MNKIIASLLVGLIMGTIITCAYAVKQYNNREIMSDFSSDSIPILNNIIEDMRNNIKDLDHRAANLEQRIGEIR
ncbi:MAG: hypothetical protein WC810_02990 [Janthinobacterium sp.]|jgi:hypothetical protein